MMEYANSPLSTAKTFQMVQYTNISVIKRAIIKQFFPNSDRFLENVELSDFSLIKAKNRPITSRKLASLATKARDFVDANQRAYYPSSIFSTQILDGSDGPTLKKVRTARSSILPKRLVQILSKKNNTKANETPVPGQVVKGASNSRMGNILSFLRRIKLRNLLQQY